MDKREAIKYLEERLEEIPALSKLRYSNSKYSLWLNTVRGVAEKVFGKDSYEYQKLAQVYTITGSFAEEKQNSYVRILRKRATAILSIIQTWEATGFETEKDLKPLVAFDPKANWKAIESEFGITKTGFGRKMRFITDPFKRTIIFRDIEHAFILASAGFSKPAVILAGSVIEELLRLYLKYKNINPIKNNFDGYIQTCEQNKLLEVGISRLSDSTRHFRNLVHLSKEKTPKDTTSKSKAKGAVASIFTIADDF